MRLLTATLLTKLAHETPTALLLAHGQDALRTLTRTLTLTLTLPLTLTLTLTLIPNP